MKGKIKKKDYRKNKRDNKDLITFFNETTCAIEEIKTSLYNH